MTPLWVIRGRTITLQDVQAVQQLVVVQANAGRWALARALCEQWRWRGNNGRLKARSAMAVLTELERHGQVRLPPPSPSSLRLKAVLKRPGNVPRPPEATLGGTLNDYGPLRWELVRSAAQRRLWRQLFDQHHYLGAPQLVGAHLTYLVYGRAGELLGALGWQSAVHHLGCRDRLLGWNAAQRARGLERVVNGVRFLVLPWVKVPNLASVLLSQSLPRLQRDWRERYGVSVGLVESFVDRRRFSGVSYRAANWVAIGWTRGFAKRQGSFVHHGQTKEVYAYVIEPRLRRQVHADAQQPLLTRAYLLAQRAGEIPSPSKRARMKTILESWQPKLPPAWKLSLADLALVLPELNAFTALFHGAFRRIELEDLFELSLQGLLSHTERKNCEAMALALDGPERVRNLQRFMSDYQWDESWMRQQHWQLTAELLSDAQGVWSIDASEFAKKGKDSVGVAPMYCGALGKTANCQSGVFICYASPQGHALLDSRLYLPQVWFEPGHAERFLKCRIPPDITFHTKPQLAIELFARLQAQKLFAGHWITCDCSFGNNEAFLAALPQEFYYLAEIACTRKVWIAQGSGHPKLEREGCTVETLVTIRSLWHWETHKVAEGEKGPIVAGFARLRVYLNPERTAESERWLVLRNDPDGQIKYYLSNAPREIPMAELVRVSAARWPIERCFEEDKSELGLDHYEHRSWKAWHRHMRLVFVAQLFLLRLRQKFKKNSGPDPAPSAPTHRMEFAGTQTPAGVRADLRALPSAAQLPSLSIPS
jgi:SRSO17 transposase